MSVSTYAVSTSGLQCGISFTQTKNKIKTIKLKKNLEFNEHFYRTHIEGRPPLLHVSEIFLYPEYHLDHSQNVITSFFGLALST